LYDEIAQISGADAEDEEGKNNYMDKVDHLKNNYQRLGKI